MSYDLQLFRVPAGANPATEYARQRAEWTEIRQKQGASPWGPVDPLKEQAKQRLAAALVAGHPELQLYDRDYARIARAKSIDEDEARRRYRHLELTDLRLGLQVSLFDDTAAVSVPLGQRDSSLAETTMRAAWRCLTVLETEAKFSIYDSQVGRVLSLDSDFKEILEGYVRAGRIVRDTLDRRRM
jgi:hypothetical protein